MYKLKKTILAMIGCLVAILGIIILLNYHRGNKPEVLQDNSISLKDEVLRDEQVQHIILKKQDEHNKLVRSEILQGNVGQIDSMAIRNTLPSECNDSTPLIEFRSFERKLDGSIEPFHLITLGLLSQVPKGERRTGADFGVNGYGLRLALTDIKEKLDECIYLAWDTEYRAIGIYYLPDDPNLISVKTPELRFRTPKSLSPGEIYRVDLILIDRIKEKAEHEQAIIDQEQLAKKVIEETITLQINDLYQNDEPMFLSLGYNDGNKGYNFERVDNNKFILKGPNKLGGELVVCRSNMQGIGRAWFYIKNVQKRNLQLPDDASMVLNEEEMIPATISLAQTDPNILSDKKVIAFYPDVNANFFLFWIVLDNGGFEKLQNNNWQTELKVLPGTYNVKLLRNMETSLDMGVVEFTNESGKTYTLELK